MSQPIKSTFEGIAIEIRYVGADLDSEWKCFQWSVKIGSETFQYKTGLGHSYSDYSDSKHMIPMEIRKAFGDRFRPLPKLSERPKTLPEFENKVRAVIPSIESILQCLILDAQAGTESFDSFCYDLGYSNDSLKALDSYRACMETKEKLRKALGKEFTRIVELIEKMEI